MFKKPAVVAICLAFLGGYTAAPDAKTVIASAQNRAASASSPGSAKDVAFQQCGANAAA